MGALTRLFRRERAEPRSRLLHVAQGAAIPADRHVVTATMSGVDPLAQVVVPNAARWPHPVVVLDGEIVQDKGSPHLNKGRCFAALAEGGRRQRPARVVGTGHEALDVLGFLAGLPEGQRRLACQRLAWRLCGRNRDAVGPTFGGSLAMPTLAALIEAEARTGGTLRALGRKLQDEEVGAFLVLFDSAGLGGHSMVLDREILIEVQQRLAECTRWLAGQHADCLSGGIALQEAVAGDVFITVLPKVRLMAPEVESVLIDILALAARLHAPKDAPVLILLPDGSRLGFEGVFPFDPSEGVEDGLLQWVVETVPCPALNGFAHLRRAQAVAWHYVGLPDGTAGMMELGAVLHAALPDDQRGAVEPLARMKAAVKPGRFSAKVMREWTRQGAVAFTFDGDAAVGPPLRPGH